MKYSKIGFSILAVFYSFYVNAQSNTNKQVISAKKWERISKKISPPGFTLVKGGTFTSSNFDIIPDNDTSVLISESFNFDYRRITISSFIISKTEVTNKEYREFTNWVVDSMALTIKAEKDASFYKDASLKTLDWSRRNEIRDSNSFASLYPLYIKNDVNKNNGYLLNTNYVNYKFTKYDSLNVAINIYPDTLVWYKDRIGWDSQLAQLYFSNAAYNDYPVVGISWDQANAYCNWLNKKAEDHNYGYNKAFYYRLPTAAEFEYCQNLQSTKRYFVNKKYNKSFFSGNHIASNTSYDDFKLSDNKGKYLAKFGPIIDKNNFVVKGRGYSPVKVASYPKWGFGLFDIAGNVSEWIWDATPHNFYLDDYDLGFLTKIKKNLIIDKVDSAIRSNIYITTKDSFDSIYKKVYDYLGYKDGYKYWLEIGAPRNLNDFNKILQAQESKAHNYDNDLTGNLIYKVNLILHDFKVLDKLNNPKVVMGGSWNDGPAFMERGVKQAYSHNESHSTIGFRVVASAMIDELDNP